MAGAPGPARSCPVGTPSAALPPPPPRRAAAVAVKHPPHLPVPRGPPQPSPPHNPAPPSAPPPRSGPSWPVRPPGPVRWRQQRRRRRRAEEGAAERRVPEPTGGGEGGGRCGGVGLERGVTQLTGAVRSRAAGAELEPAERSSSSSSGRSEQRRTASVAVGSGAASRPPPREPGEPAAQSRRQPRHHVPRQQAEKALAGGERYCRPSRRPVPGPGPLLPPSPLPPAGEESAGRVCGGCPVLSEPLPSGRGVPGGASRPPGRRGRGRGRCSVLPAVAPGVSHLKHPRGPPLLPRLPRGGGTPGVRDFGVFSPHLGYRWLTLPVGRGALVLRAAARCVRGGGWGGGTTAPLPRASRPQVTLWKCFRPKSSAHAAKTCLCALRCVCFFQEKYGLLV